MESAGNSVASLLNRPRPIVNLVDCHDEELTCAAKPVDMVYVRNCTGCKVHVQGNAAKCILGASAACSRVHVLPLCMLRTCALLSAEWALLSAEWALLHSYAASFKLHALCARAA